MGEQRQAPSFIPGTGEGRVLARLNVARQEEDLAVSKARVRPRKPMDQLPALAIGHHWCFAADKAASRQQLKRRNADPAKPIAPMSKELNPARVDPVLRVLVGSHFGRLAASLGSETQCGPRLRRPVHQKMSSAPICYFERAGRNLHGIRGEVRNEERRP